MLWLAVLAPAAIHAQSPRIEVFTTSQVSVVNTGNAQVYVVDALRAITQTLSQGLPKQPEHAKQVALARIQAGGQRLQRDVQGSATALAKAAQYGIDRVPAVVFDGRVLVYGVADLALAQQHYQQWRRSHTGARP